MWYTEKDNFHFGEKYVPVKIINIGVSDRNTGLYKFVFTDEATNEYCIDTRLSGTNDFMEEYKLILYERSSPTFDKIFSFTDPKIQYPKIPSSRWKLIQKGEIKIGMTKVECELSYGYPDSKNETSNKYGKSEQWIYESSIGENTYLYFKNGTLTSIQN